MGSLQSKGSELAIIPLEDDEEVGTGVRAQQSPKWQMKDREVPN